MARIRVRQKRSWFSCLFIVALLVGLWRVYARRSRERIPGPEGVEDPEVSAAFEWVSSLPQMRWMRHFVTTQATVLQDHGEAVDLGCGAGQLVIEMAQQAPGLHIIGIDLSEKLLADARRYAQQAGLGDRVDFRLGNVEAIPLPDHSLDLVISTASLHHWTDPVKVMNEIDRVLKPSGVFYIFDLRRDMALPFYLLLWVATQFIAPAPLHQINEPMASRNAAYTVSELADLARCSKLRGWQASGGPAWVILDGQKSLS